MILPLNQEAALLNFLSCICTETLPTPEVSAAAAVRTLLKNRETMEANDALVTTGFQLCFKDSLLKCFPVNVSLNNRFGTKE